VKCRLITGKTHQIRSQLLHLGHPIIGDIKYCSDSSRKTTKDLSVKRQMLHCYRVTIPTDFDTITVTSSPAADMKKLLRKLGFRNYDNLQEL
jgi:23S rRNA-/tRNA-specific pseudouridylate synthase